MSSAPLRVAVAGATGFVGCAIVERLGSEHSVVALGRRAPGGASLPERPVREPGVLWRRCDLFDLEELTRVLGGVDVALYLVHSMMPRGGTTQGSFEDLDLTLADNFGRAAAAAGVQRIVYLGGLVPEGGRLSAHLRSRLEVESALSAHGVPVTAVRAGLVVGPGGSSLRILLRLVRRLPAMLCPRWTSTPTQPIALDDVVALLACCVEDPGTSGRVCEVGGPDVMTYRQLMAETARVLGLRRWMVSVPFFSPGLSRLWVSLVTRTPRALVNPLIESLRHPMVVRDPWLQERLKRPGLGFAEALSSSLSEDAEEGVRSTSDAVPRSRVPVRARSVQRLPRPPGWEVRVVGEEYLRWLPRFFRRALRVEVDGKSCRFRVPPLRRPLLELEFDPASGSSDRAVLTVAGGLLVDPAAPRPGRLEFRTTPDGLSILSGVHDFAPRLPLKLYRFTQAVLHQWVMNAFGRHLERVGHTQAPGHLA